LLDTERQVTHKFGLPDMKVLTVGLFEDDKRRRRVFITMRGRVKTIGGGLYGTASGTLTSMALNKVVRTLEALVPPSRASSVSSLRFHQRSRRSVTLYSITDYVYRWMAILQRHPRLSRANSPTEPRRSLPLRALLECGKKKSS